MAGPDEVPGGRLADDQARGGLPEQELPEEGLPEEDDPYWDDVSSAALRLLRELRVEHRRRRLRGAAYAGYVATLAVLIYVVPYLAAAIPARSPARGELPPAAGALPLVAVAVVLLIVVALVRDASWRGPALLDEATAAWLLPAPVRRGALLRPRLRATLAAGVVLGFLAGACAGALLRPVAVGGAAALALGGAVAGATAAGLGVALAGVVQSAAGRGHGWGRWGGGWLWVLPALPAGYAVAWLVHPTAAVRGTGRVLTAVALWSGPWGWCVQPLARALRGGAVGGAWPVGLVAGVVVTGLVARAADRGIAAVPGWALRARAATLSSVTSSLGTLQPRRARLLVQAAQGWAPRTGWRLPVPPSPHLLWVWRDATTVLRMPARLVWGVLWFALAAAVTAGSAAPVPVGPDARAQLVERLAVRVSALVAGYLAAAQLVEAARLDADDPGLVRQLPVRARALAWWHAVVPLLVLGAGAGIAMGVAAAAGSPPPVLAALGRLALALPALVGSALVSAYRGDLPSWVMVGAPTPLGDTGPVQTLLWYARGPLVGVGLLVPFALGAGAPVVIAVAAVMLSWAGQRAHHVLSG